MEVVKLIDIKDEAKNIKTFLFKSDKKIRYNAGQFIELHAQHEHDERGKKRWFTLSSSPTEDFLSVTTKIDQVKSSSFKSFLLNAPVGTKLDMALPMGDFVLPKDPQFPIIFVAGGMGVTPFRSMLKYLSDNEEKRSISMIYAVPDKAEVAFEPLLKKATEKLIITEGKFKLEQIIKLGQHYKEPLYYLAGPEHMVENLQKELIAQGISPDYIRVDFFLNYD